MQEKPSIIIQTEDRKAVFDILNWILRYASGDQKLPNLGEKPLYNALMLNRTAELLGLPTIMLSEIKEAMKSLTGSYLSSERCSGYREVVRQRLDMTGNLQSTIRPNRSMMLSWWVNSDKAGRIRDGDLEVSRVWLRL